MREQLRRLWILIPAAALLALLVGGYLTRGAMEQLAFLRRSQGTETGLVDQRPWQTAVTLAPLAVAAEEQAFAQDAERLSDHEVDQAFAMALRQATMKKRVLTGEALATEQHVAELKARMADDKARVDQLTDAARKSGAAPEPGDDLDIAKAQLELDNDELTDATGDLEQQSGDQRAQIQQELQARQASVKKVSTGQGETAVLAVKRYGTLAGRVKAWFDQRSRVKLLEQAESSARLAAKDLAAQHDALEKKSGDAAIAQTDSAVGANKVKMLERLGSQRAVMSLLDDRMGAELQLAAVYARWQAQVWMQHRIVSHLLLISFSWIAATVLCAALGIVLGSALIGRVSSDLRRTRTLITIFELAVQVLALLAILLVIFGPPQQMPTILGLATAGLTVVFQDFILAFFGWFVLMGRNGIRVGDWVEIDSVGGEVSEIGLMRTTLLETGNWASSGHPTGRRVTFINSFAIRGKYFNFSTHGQWMWDEIQVNVPSSADAYAAMDEINRQVCEATAADSEEAERDWLSATRQNGLSQFTAKASLDLRPAGAGVDVIVRFITRAGERFEQRKKLFASIMQVLEAQRPKPEEAEVSTAAPA